MKIFLTGLSGSGKSTVLIKTIELLKEKNPKNNSLIYLKVLGLIGLFNLKKAIQ